MSRLGVLVSSIPVAITLVACDTALGDRDADQDFQDFVELAESAEEQGFTPYWLGRSFEAGGLRFEGPGVPDFGAEITGGGISMSYAAPLEGDGTAPLYINLYTRDAWSRVRDGITMPRDRTTRQSVTVLGREAELLLISAGTRPVAAARLIVDLGDTIVYANVHSVGSPPGGGPDQNPLLIAENLLPVMEQLRPYPE